MLLSLGEPSPPNFSQYRTVQSGSLFAAFAPSVVRRLSVGGPGMGPNGFHTVSRTNLLILALDWACADAAKADGFSTGEFVTHAQVIWGGTVANPAAAVKSVPIL
jgi:hypothetical protein